MQVQSGKRRRVSKLSLKYRAPPLPSPRLNQLVVVKKRDSPPSNLLSPEKSISPTQMHTEEDKTPLSKSSPRKGFVHASPPSPPSNLLSPEKSVSPTQVHTEDARTPPPKSCPRKESIHASPPSHFLSPEKSVSPTQVDSKEAKTPPPKSCPKKELGDGPMDGLFWRCEYCGQLVPKAYTTYNSKILEKRIRHYKKCAEGAIPHIIAARPEDTGFSNNERLSMELLLPNNAVTGSSISLTTQIRNSTVAPAVKKNAFDVIMENREKHRRQPGGSGTKLLAQKNAFSILMQRKNKGTRITNRKKKRPWSRRLASSRDPSSIPHYKLVKVGGNSKRLQPIVVDGFQYSSLTLSRIYFLSHFHSDHYIGLRKTFSDGIIYCTQVTANLLLRQFKINPVHVRALPLNKPVKLDMQPNAVVSPDGAMSKPVQVVVTLIDANHCPGSCIMLFQIGNKSPYRFHLHTGDFRYIKSMRAHNALKDIHHFECLYLDTTYCNPKYDFPPQIKSIESSLKALERNGAGSKTVRRDTLFLFGSYSIGKEKIFMACAEKFNVKIYVSAAKFGLIKCFNWPREKMKSITRDISETSFHVVPMGVLSFKRIGGYVSSLKKKYRRVIAIRPTGWSYGGGTRNSYEGISSVHTTRVNGSIEVTVFGVAYSEHSSFSELQHCVKDFPSFIIKPTVNAYTRSAEEQMLQLLGHRG